MDITHPGQQLIFYSDVFVEFVYTSLFIVYIRIIVIPCIHLCSWHGSDFIYLCSINIVLVLVDFLLFRLCMFLHIYGFFFWLLVLGFATFLHVIHFFFYFFLTNFVFVFVDFFFFRFCLFFHFYCFFFWLRVLGFATFLHVIHLFIYSYFH